MRSAWTAAIVGFSAFCALLWWRFDGPPAPGAAESSPGLAPPGAAIDAAAGRGEKESAPAQEPREDAGEAKSSVPIVIDDEATMQALFLSLAGRLEGPMRAWAESRGMPRKDPSGNFMLAQPYQQYDDETLRALADNGDMWAQQILADRISMHRPAEAMELYRRAASSGSVHAMLQIAALSARVAAISPDFSFEEDDVALEQYYSLRDAPVGPDVMAYAWRAVAELAGLPGIMGMTGDGQIPAGGAETGCELAGSIYSDLLQERAAANLGGYPSDPPPVWMAGGATGGQGTACEHEQAVVYDFSSCELYVFPIPQSEEDTSIYVCQDF